MRATQCIKWNVNNKKVGCLWCLSFNFYTLRNKNSTSENILVSTVKKYLSNATQLPDSIKTCIFLMLLYLCFATRKNYALIGSIISSIHTQNGFKHQQCIVQGVIHCYIRKFQHIQNQISVSVSNYASFVSYCDYYRSVVYGNTTHKSSDRKIH